MTRTLLIINDDIDSCTLFEEYISSRNSAYSVKTANDSIEAIRIARAFKPTVAIVDRNLREGNGTGLNLALHLKRAFGTDCILTSSEYNPLSHQDETDMQTANAKAAFNTPIRSYDALIKTIDSLMGPDTKREAQ